MPELPEPAISIVHLPPEALNRIGEIDRSEDTNLSYTQNGAEIHARPANWHIPRWSTNPRDGFSVRVQIDYWAPILQNGGTLFGALLGKHLAGFAILRPELAPRTAELSALFVDRSQRRKGIAAALLRAVEALARLSGAQQLYVSSVPSQAAVGFYLNQGFEPTPYVHPELYRRKPTDIHMIKQLEY